METLVTQIYTLYSLGFNSCPDVQSFFSFFCHKNEKKNRNMESNPGKDGYRVN